MSKRKEKKYKITAEQMFDFQKPKFNGFTCGYGVHGKDKYCRKQKHKNKEFEDVR